MTDQTPARYSIVGTAGHIDHGKSALVEALTGTHPDRLREERERGITIDLGFADARIGDAHVAFVDVPGHERFVRNMLAGVGGIDAVLLVVAADESVMPQTREHFAICQLLGIDKGVVAITKGDLVDADIAELVALEVEELLAGTSLRGAPTVVTSVVNGDGLEPLREALADCLASTGDRPAEGLVRLPVDRAFTMKGFGTVVTGTLWSGRVRLGDQLELLPSGRSVTVRGIQVHGQACDEARAGQRTALNLQGVAVDQISRGDVLSEEDGLEPSSIVDAQLQVLPGFRLEHLQRVRFHHGAVELLGRVALLGTDELAGGTTGPVQLRLESPYALAPGDRFILRRYSPTLTIAGGVVLDPLARKRRPHEPVAELLQLREMDERARLARWVREAGPVGAAAPRLRRRLAVPRARFDRLVAEAAAAGGLVEVAGPEPRIVDAEVMRRLQERILASLRRYHDRYPVRPAMPKRELAAEIALPGGERVLDAALLAAVDAEAVLAAADGYAAAEHRVAFDADADRIREELLSRFGAGGVAPPPPSEILAAAGDEPTAREILHHLLREGTVVRIRDDLIIAATAIDALVNDLRTRLAAGESFGVADFKAWTGLTRKHSIPLLEYLDQRRVTRRVGDARVRV